MPFPVQTAHFFTASSLASFTRSSSILLVARLPIFCTGGARELRSA